MGVLGNLFTPIPNRPKDAACRTFHNVPQPLCPSVKRHTAMNGRQFSEAISSAKVPENHLSVKVSQLKDCFMTWNALLGLHNASSFLFLLF